MVGKLLTDFSDVASWTASYTVSHIYIPQNWNILIFFKNYFVVVHNMTNMLKNWVHIQLKIYYSPCVIKKEKLRTDILKNNLINTKQWA